MAMIQQQDRDKANAVAGAKGAPLLASVSKRDRDDVGEEDKDNNDDEDDEDEEEIYYLTDLDRMCRSITVTSF